MLKVIGSSITARLFTAGAFLFLGSLMLVAYCSALVPQITSMQHRSEALSLAMRNHIEADMLDDAMRGTGFAALHVNSGIERTEVRANMADYSRRLGILFAQDQRLDLAPGTAALMADAQHGMENYAREAESFVSLALRDPTAAETKLPAFNRRFQELKTSNALASGHLQQELASSGKAMGKLLDRLYFLEWFAGVAAGGMVAALIIYLRRRIILPVVRITRALDMDSADVLTAERERADEIGQLAESVIVFRETAMATQEAERALIAAEEEARREREEASRKAEEAAREAAEAERKRALAATAQSLEQRLSGIAHDLTATTERLRQVADALAGSAQQSRHETTSAAAAAQQTLDGVQSIAEAADELVVSITEVSSRISQVAQSGDEVRDLVATASERMATLDQAAGHITNVTALIASIAARTNLLALNATIEAAQAGDAGRGFAVVASEVKELADQTATAVRDIDRQISAIVDLTRDTGSSIAHVSTAIDSLSGATNSIATAADQQGLTTQEISRTIRQSSEGTTMMRENLAQMDEQAEATARNAAIVRDAANELGGKAAELGREIADFIAQTRAA